MKVQIRRGVFETNSSSVHTLTMCTLDEFDKWQDGELYLNRSYFARGGGTFVTKEEVINLLKEDDYYSTRIDWNEVDNMSDGELINFLYDYGFYTYGGYDSRDLEYYEGQYTTPGGETVVCFGMYGHDG